MIWLVIIAREDCFRLQKNLVVLALTSDMIIIFQQPILRRRAKLDDSQSLHRLYRDIDDEEAWIRDKEPVVSSQNRGRDLMGVQNLIKKHHGVMSEIQSHEPHVENVAKAADDMVDQGHFAAAEIRDRRNGLVEHWNLLKSKAAQRKQDLEDSLQAHQYFADANEAESWMREKEPLVVSRDIGRDEDSAEAALKKHEAVTADLGAFGSTIQALHDQAEACKVSKRTLEVDYRMNGRSTDSLISAASRMEKAIVKSLEVDRLSLQLLQEIFAKKYKNMKSLLCCILVF